MNERLGGAAKKREFNWGDESSGDRPDVIMPDYEITSHADSGRTEAANTAAPIEQTNDVPRVAPQRNVETNPDVLAKSLGDFDADLAEAPRSASYVAPQDPAAPTGAQMMTADRLYAGSRPENLSQVRIPSAGGQFSAPGEPGEHGEVPGDIRTAGLSKYTPASQGSGSDVNMGYSKAFKSKPPQKNFFRRMLGL